MTYTNVKKILADKDAAVIEEYKELVPMFEKMAELAAILRKKRMKRGSIAVSYTHLPAKRCSIFFRRI